MRYWKIGSRWNAHGDKNSSILDVFLENDIAFVKEENTRGIMMRDVKVGDIIAISDGQKIVASAEVRTKPDYLRNFPSPRPGQNEIFDYEEEKDDTVAVSITFRKKEMNVFYGDRRAFCEIHKGDVKNQL